MEHVNVAARRLAQRLRAACVVKGVGPRTTQELGGWRSLAMVERYTHLSPTHKAEAVERIAENFPTVFTTPAPPRTRASRGDRRVNAV